MTTGGEELVFHPRRRRAVERLLVEVALSLSGLLGGAVLIGSGPVDYRAYTFLAVGIVVMCLMPFVLRLVLGGRVPVVLTRAGVGSGISGPGRIPWTDIVRVQPVWTLQGWHIQLNLRGGRTKRLDAPWGSAWLPDPTFDREMAGFRQWAARYDALIDYRTHDRRVKPLTIALVALTSLAVAAGLRAAHYGVIWPWTLTASHATAACPALHAAGLDRYWPADTRTLERDEEYRHDLGEYSYCGWVNRLDRAQDAPYMRLSAVVKRHSAYGPFSPIGIAASSFHDEYVAVSSPAPASGLADEAFTTSAPDRMLVTARRANVTVSVEISLDPQRPHNAEEPARALAAAILADIRMGDGTSW